MKREIFDADSMSTGEFYRMLTAVVVPRPIAWVSSISQEGVANLAPHSFYTVSSVKPPIIQFTSVGEKDTLRNIESQGEFVVNLTPASLFEQVNATGTDFPPETSEFDAAGLTREASTHVSPPRVAESPVALECHLHSTHPIGNCTVVFGQVISAVISSDVLEGTHPHIDRLDPLSRLGGDDWATMGSIKTIKRIKMEDWPGTYKR